MRIATQIINDVYEKKCDNSIVVSADSDMVPAIELAVKSGHEVSVFFPDVVHLKSSDFDLKIPEKWKNYQNM